MERDIIAVFDELVGCEAQVKADALAAVDSTFTQVCGAFGQLDSGRLTCPSTCNIPACESEICG